MALSAGDKLGPYEIVSSLGVGGMGEVYRARDMRLGREVALKVVPPHLAQDENAHKRFHQEARILSSLNHPNIASVYEFDTEAGVEFLVMELVSGSSLREKLLGGALPIPDVMKLGRQIAEGLVAAHDAGIVHRDLKPENVIVSPQGRLKILDFGLAKLTGSAIAAAATASFATEAGATPGTLPYMAPEQLRAAEPDARMDVYACGAVLYEMATGSRLFDQHGLMLVDSILHAEPVPPVQLNREVPQGLSAIILRAVEKEPTDRFQSARELADALEQVMAGGAYVAQPHRRRTFRLPRVMIWGAALVGAAAAIVAAILIFGADSSVPHLEYEQLTNFADSAVSPSLSTDGKMLAFIRGESTFFGPGEVYVRMLPNGEPVQLTRDKIMGKLGPRFAPDGSRITYSSGPEPGAADALGGTWMVPALGGQAGHLFLAEAIGLSWFQDPAGQPRLLYSEFTHNGAQLGVVSSNENRGDRHVLYMPPAPAGMAHRSAISPDRKYVLISAEMDAANWLPCHVVNFDGKAPPRLVGPPQSQCTGAAWSPDGKWMYFTANVGSGFHIWRQRFPDGVARQITSGTTEEEGVDFAPDGKSFVTAIGTRQSTIWVHDKKGERQVTSDGYGLLPTFSPDGTKLYFMRKASATGSFVSGSFWVVDLLTGEQHALLPGFLLQAFDISPDGKRVVFVAAGNTEDSPVWIAPLDGSAAPRRLSDKSATIAVFGGPGEVLLASDVLYSVREDGTGLRNTGAPGNAYALSVSPDGRWLSIWDMPGFLVAVAVDGGARVVVSRAPPLMGIFESAPWPAGISWSRDGRYIYIKQAIDSMYALPLPPGQMFPNIPKGGFQTEQQLASYPGAIKVSSLETAFPGPNPSIFAFTRVATQRNIYRVSLR